LVERGYGDLGLGDEAIKTFSFLQFLDMGACPGQTLEDPNSQPQILPAADALGIVVDEMPSKKTPSALEGCGEKTRTAVFVSTAVRPR
jgi:hypothetical protein